MRRESQQQRPPRGPVRPRSAPGGGAGGPDDGTPAAGDADGARPDTLAGGPDGGTAARGGGLRLRWALLIGLAGGLALTAAFPPYGIWPLAAAGPALLVVALRQQSLRGSFAAPSSAWPSSCPSCLGW